MRARTYISALFGLVAVSAMSKPAGAFELFADDETAFSLKGLGEVGMIYEEHSGAAPTRARVGRFQSAQLRMARIAAVGSVEELGAAKLQIEGRSGSVELLDLNVAADVMPWLHVAAGRFKIPVSREFMIPAARMRVSNRALIREFAPGRGTGLQATADAHIGELDVEGALGLFQLPGTSFAEDGQLLTARAVLEPWHHVEIHAAFAEHIFGNGLDAAVAGLEAADQNVFPEDHQLDAAIGYHGKHLHLLGEGLVSFGPNRGQHPWAAHASAGYLFAVRGVGVEPALAYDVLQENGQSRQRGATALNVYWDETRLMTTAEYEVEELSGQLTHTASLLVQAGF